MAFTALQRLFIDYYCLEKNGTKAARLAGYKGNDNVLGVTAYENLRNPKIRAEIDRRFSETAMGKDEVLARLADIARIDMAEFITVKHNVPMLNLEKAEQAHALHLLKKFKVTKQGIEIDVYDAQAALETLGKHLGLFNTIKIEDWRSEAIALIRSGEVTFNPLAEELGNDLAIELFKSAGIAVVSTGAASSSEREDA